MYVKIILTLLLYLLIDGTDAKRKNLETEKEKEIHYKKYRFRHVKYRGHWKKIGKLIGFNVAFKFNSSVDFGDPIREVNDAIYRLQGGEQKDKGVLSKREAGKKNLVKKAKNNKRKKGKKTPPHIIFLLVDDLGFNDVGWHMLGGSVIRTPFLERLAWRGVRLENYYVQHVCSPTRSSLMTGRYQIHMGLQHVNFSPADGLCVPLKEKFLPEQLRELGYETHAVGKWHLGMSRMECLPTRRGFDSFFGILTGTSDHYKHTRKIRIADKTTKALAFYQNETATSKFQGQYCTHIYTKRAQQIIRNHDPEKPLFLYMAFQMVHSPPQVPNEYKAKYKIIRRSRRRTYAGQVSIMDEAIQNVTLALKRTGLLENSVIIFSSDNGGKPQQQASNWPLRGGKGSIWEGGVRSPAFVYSPLLPSDVRGTVNWGLMHVTDWLPTLVAGVARGNLSTMPFPLDGHNLWKSIRSGGKSPRKELLHNIDPTATRSDWRIRDRRTWGNLEDLPFNATIRAAIRVGDWKLLTGNQRSGALYMPYESNTPKKDRKIIYHGDSAIQLYDIRGDPGEKYNLAAHYPEKVMSMLKKLRRYYKGSVKPLKVREHYKKMNPRRYGGVWTPWLKSENDR